MGNGHFRFRRTSSLEEGWIDRWTEHGPTNRWVEECKDGCMGNCIMKRMENNVKTHQLVREIYGYKVGWMGKNG